MQILVMARAMALGCARARVAPACLSGTPETLLASEPAAQHGRGGVQGGQMAAVAAAQGAVWQRLPGRWRPLHLALALSLAVHAVLLTIRFVDPAGFQRFFADAPLEVVLVNARSSEPPPKAQAIAQANLVGGGDAASGRSTSPLPSAELTRPGDAAEAARQRVERLQQEQMRLLAQLRREAEVVLARLPARDGTPEQQAEREQQLLRLKQLAEIDKRVQEENARPRRRHVSPATREAVYALYYDALRLRVERRGTEDFPQVQGRKLYGELTMEMTVDAAGRVVEARVLQSSGQRALDERALAIVRAAAPFGPFNAEMRRQADLIVVTSRFRFTRDDGLEASIGVAPVQPAAGGTALRAPGGRP
jgi:protein TonB